MKLKEKIVKNLKICNKLIDEIQIDISKIYEGNYCAYFNSYMKLENIKVFLIELNSLYGDDK